MGRVNIEVCFRRQAWDSIFKTCECFARFFGNDDLAWDVRTSMLVFVGRHVTRRSEYASASRVFLEMSIWRRTSELRRSFSLAGVGVNVQNIRMLRTLFCKCPFGMGRENIEVRFCRQAWDSMFKICECLSLIHISEPTRPY